MKLWLVSQDDNGGYDTYDSFIACCETEDEARDINPDGDWGKSYSAWASRPMLVKVEYLGEASDAVERGVVLASFNAG